MPKYHSLLLAASLALGGAMFVGCDDATTTDTVETPPAAPAEPAEPAQTDEPGGIIDVDETTGRQPAETGTPGTGAASPTTRPAGATGAGTGTTGGATGAGAGTPR